MIDPIFMPPFAFIFYVPNPEFSAQPIPSGTLSARRRRSPQTDDNSTRLYPAQTMNFRVDRVFYFVVQAKDKIFFRDLQAILSEIYSLLDLAGALFKQPGFSLRFSEQENQCWLA